MYSPASQICEKKEGARKPPFLRNILHNAGKWEGRNNWEMGKRSSSKLWLSIIFLLCRCLCCLALAPGPDHTPGSVITALLTVMCMPCLSKMTCGLYYIEMQLCSIPAWLGAPVLAPRHAAGAPPTWDIPHKCFIIKTDSNKPPPSHWPAWGQDSQQAKLKTMNSGIM